MQQLTDHSANPILPYPTLQQSTTSGPDTCHTNTIGFAPVLLDADTESGSSAFRC